MSKNIFIVRCEAEVFSKKFEKKKKSDIINYLEIKQRLTNNDIFKNPPSPEILEFHIEKKINSFKKCKKSEFLFLYRSTIDMNFVKWIKKVFNRCNYETNFHLVTQNENESHNITEQFKTVHIIDLL